MVILSLLQIDYDIRNMSPPQTIVNIQSFLFMRDHVQSENKVPTRTKSCSEFIRLKSASWIPSAEDDTSAATRVNDLLTPFASYLIKGLEGCFEVAWGRDVL